MILKQQLNSDKKLINKNNNKKNQTAIFFGWAIFFGIKALRGAGNTTATQRGCAWADYNDNYNPARVRAVTLAVACAEQCLPSKLPRLDFLLHFCIKTKVEKEK